MSDLISRSALIKAMEEERQFLLARGQTGAEHILVHHCLPIIDNAPTVDIKDEIAGAYNEGYMCGSKEAEKAKESEIIKAYTKGFDTGVETVKGDTDKCDCENKLYCPAMPKGEWTIGYTAKQKKVAVCNLCNCISFQGKTNFCHNCGAKMQKG